MHRMDKTAIDVTAHSPCQNIDKGSRDRRDRTLLGSWTRQQTYTLRFGSEDAAVDEVHYATAQ